MKWSHRVFLIRASSPLIKLDEQPAHPHVTDGSYMPCTQGAECDSHPVSSCLGLFSTTPYIPRSDSCQQVHSMMTPFFLDIKVKVQCIYLHLAFLLFSPIFQHS